MRPDAYVVSLGIVNVVSRAAYRPRRDGFVDFSVGYGGGFNIGAERVGTRGVVLEGGALDFVALGMRRRSPGDSDGAISSCGREGIPVWEEGRMRIFGVGPVAPARCSSPPARQPGKSDATSDQD